MVSVRGGLREEGIETVRRYREGGRGSPVDGLRPFYVPDSLSVLSTHLSSSRLIGWGTVWGPFF